ncbi:MAG: alpha/beta family hydrolase [Myxococcota bacterium]
METNSRFKDCQIPVTDEISVSGVVGIPEWWPTGSRVGVVLAHDAATNLEQEFLVTLHRALADAGYLSLRFNFPFAQAGKHRPDGPALLERSFRAAVASLLPDPQNAPSRIVLGGFGLGARVASELVAQGAKTDGLVLMNFPLHPAGKPSRQRADALFRLATPLLFVQGTKDPTCRVDRLQALVRKIGAPHEVRVLNDADHLFQPARGSPRTREEVHGEAIGAVTKFLAKVARSL